MPKRICKIEECGQPHYGLGLCRAHYARRRRHGDAEAGSTMFGAPDEALEGIIAAGPQPHCVTWPFAISGNGYALITRDGRRQRVSRIICQHFKGPPPSPAHQAAHNCGNGRQACVNPGCLEWKTRADNEADKKRHGTDNSGERNGVAKLNREKARAIRLNPDHLTQAELATKYGVHAGTIQAVIDGRTWRNA